MDILVHARLTLSSKQTLEKIGRGRAGGGGMLTVCQQAIIPAKVEQYLHVARYIMFRPESRKESHIQDAVHYFVSVNGQILKQVRR